MVTGPYRAPPGSPPIEPPRSFGGAALIVAVATWLVVLVADRSFLVLVAALGLVVPVIAKTHGS